MKQTMSKVTLSTLAIVVGMGSGIGLLELAKPTPEVSAQ